MQRKTDFLIIGSGLAGLSYALKVADYGTVIVLTKASMQESNTRYAQGGIAAVTLENDSYEKHIQDTLTAGDYICDEKIVRMVVEEAPERIKELIGWGVNFDKTKNGDYDLAKEGGHSEHRILHHKDNTGHEMERALISRIKAHPNITILEYYFAIDLITQHHLGKTVVRYQNDITCYGVYALNIKTNKIETVLGKTTYLATGGIGNIYNVTTNPIIATGDGIAMVYRAKGLVDNLEFVQFHPTALYNPNERPSFLITEAMRGFGAVLKTINGNEFMHKYDVRGCLAPRDIVARAIDNEMKLSGDEFVYLYASHLNKEKLIAHFPTIYERCLKIGIDITKDPIPVVPAAHYVCGGIRVDEHGKTTISNLYAGGETAYTGLHGANRLASNSLLEALVFANRSAIHSRGLIQDINWNEKIPKWNDEGTSLPEENILITQEFKELQQIMTYYVGIVRSNLRLDRAMHRLEILYRETEALFVRATVSDKICELRNAINVGYLIIKMAKRRRESIGLHYNVDLLNKNKENS